MLVRLGANVQPLLSVPDAFAEKPEIVPIVEKVRAFLAATGLVRAEHQFALHSLAQLVEFHNLPRHASQPPPAYVEAFALRLGVVIQSQLVVAPLLVATTAARTGELLLDGQQAGVALGVQLRVVNLHCSACQNVGQVIVLRRDVPKLTMKRRDPGDRRIRPTGPTRKLQHHQPAEAVAVGEKEILVDSVYFFQHRKPGRDASAEGRWVGGQGL